MSVAEVQFTGSLCLPTADIDGLSEVALVELLQDRIGHTGAVVLNADGPTTPLHARRKEQPCP